MSGCSGSSGSKGAAKGGGGASDENTSKMTQQEAIAQTSQSAYERIGKNLDDLDKMEPSYNDFKNKLKKSVAENKDEFVKESEKVISLLKETTPVFKDSKKYIEDNAQKWAKDGILKERESSAIDAKYAKQEKLLNKGYDKAQDSLQKLLNDNKLTFTSYDGEQVPYSVQSFRTDPNLAGFVAAKYPQVAGTIQKIVKDYRSYDAKGLDLGSKRYEEKKALDIKYPGSDWRKYESNVMSKIDFKTINQQVIKLEKINPRLFKKFTESLPVAVKNTINGLTEQRY